MKTYTIGIDFGTTKTLVARVNPDTKEVEYLRLGRANNHMPTTIAIRYKGGELFFGDDADDKLKECEEYDYCRRFKLGLGSTNTSECWYQGKDNLEHFLTAKDLTREFLKYVRGKAEEEWSNPGRQLGKVVITYPVKFSRAQIDELQRAAEAAGVPHVELRYEPEAAGRAYYMDGKEKAKNKILVVDWGGGTLDISLITREGESFNTHSDLSDGDMQMGGEIFDDRLWADVNERLKAQGVTFIDKAAWKMLSIVRPAKERLSSQETCTLRLSSERGACPPLPLTRAGFNELIADSVSKAVDKVQNIIAKAAADQKPEMLLLVGGSSRIPLIKEQLASACCLPVCTWKYSREAVARGAAFIAAYDHQDASAASDAVPEQQTAPSAQTTSMSADELNALGMRYWENGDDQPQAFARAADCFRQAAQQGHREAQYNLAQCYRQGRGVPPDSQKAARWFQKAAEQGDPDAQYRMGLCYQQGGGVQKNLQQARYWFQRAAEGGHKEAQKFVNHYNNKEREANVNHPQKEASALGRFSEQHPSGSSQSTSITAGELNALGMRYWKGDGIPQDIKRAADCFRQAAQQGHREAQYNYAQCFWQGKGVPNINISSALYWFQRAAKNGHKGAQNFLNHYNKEREANANHLREEASAPSYPTEQQTSNHTPTPQAPQVSKKGLSGGAIVCIFYGGLIALSLIIAIISNFGDIIDWIFSERWHLILIVMGVGALCKALFSEK